MSSQGISEATIHQVRQSFGRSTIDDGLFVTFYDNLIASSEEIRRLFSQTNMARQRQLLRAAMVHLIAYPTGNAYAAESLLALAISHNRENLNVRPELYELWEDSLIFALSQHDPQFTDDLETDWRSLIAHGIDFMRSHYANSPGSL